MNYIVGDPQIELKWGLKWAKSMVLGETLKVKWRLMMLMCSLAVVHVQGGAGQSFPLSWPLNSKKWRVARWHTHMHAWGDLKS